MPSCLLITRWIHILVGLTPASLMDYVFGERARIAAHDGFSKLRQSNGVAKEVSPHFHSKCSSQELFPPRRRGERRGASVYPLIDREDPSLHPHFLLSFFPDRAGPS